MKFTINNSIRRMWLWIILFSLRTEYAIMMIFFGDYEQKVINEEVDRNSITYKLWFNIIERRNSKVSRYRAEIEYELGIL